jgi:hypothetical protein
MYKELWRRLEHGDHALDLAEEESVVLLGRIKGGRGTAAVMVAGTAGALFFGKNLLGLVLALGQAFLATRLYLVAQGLDRTLPPDSGRDVPLAKLPTGDAGRYVVDIDLNRVHDFIQPRVALPFWSPAEAEKWVAQCGFTRVAGGKWEGDKAALRFLDPDEIASIESCPGT